MLAESVALTADPDHERSQRHARVLQRLAEIGMNLAEAVDLQRQEDGADPAELAIKFARIAKAVRQTLALEARLADDDRVRRDAAEYRRKADQAQQTRKAKEEGFFRKGQAAMMLEKVFVSAAPDFDTDEYGEDIGEWLFDESEAELCADRPVEEIVQDICRMLKVKYDRRMATSGAAAGSDPDPPDPADEPCGGARRSADVEMQAHHPP